MSLSKTVICIILFIIIIISVLGSSFEYKENFQVQSKFIVGMFYAPWCGWSKKALPEFEKLESKYKKTHDNKIKFKLIDCDASSGKNLCQTNKITGFPDIRMFKIKNTDELDKNITPSNEIGIFQGGRTSDELFSWCTNLAK